MWGIRWNNHVLNRSGLYTGGDSPFTTREEAEQAVINKSHYFGKLARSFSEESLDRIPTEYKDSVKEITHMGITVYTYTVPAEFTHEIVDLSKDQEWIKKDLDKRRRLEYLKEGCSSEALLIALWELIVEGRPEEANAIQTKRSAVKDKIK